MESSTSFATYPSLRNRVVVVTGGASGIGEAIVEAFAMQHATVILLDIQDAAAARLIQRLESAGAAATTSATPGDIDVYDVCGLNRNRS